MDPSPPLPPSPSDLAWIASTRDRSRNRAVVETLSLRYFGRQDEKRIAAEAGLSPRALAAFFDTICLPRYVDSGQRTAVFDPVLAQLNLDQTGYSLAVCKASSRLFWRHERHRDQPRPIVDDRASVSKAPETPNAVEDDVVTS